MGRTFDRVAYEDIGPARVIEAAPSIDSSNPKDLIGQAKVSITTLPPVAILHASHAMMNGADKYGSFNWRDKKVLATVYIDAALRHILAWGDGEEIAEDSSVHHLGHAMACLAILLDAQTNGNLIDDRHKSGRVPEVLASLNQTIKDKRG